MSGDFAQEKSFELSAFEGQNNFVDATKIKPTEFVSLKNVSTTTGSLLVNPIPSSQAVPIPYKVDGGYDDYTTGSWTTKAVTNSKEIACEVTADSNISAGEPISLLLLLHATVAGSYQVSLRSKLAGGPSTEICSGYVKETYNISATANRTWVSLVVSPNTTITQGTAFYITFTPLTGTIYLTLYGSSYGTFYVLDGTWQDFKTYYTTTTYPSFIFVRSKLGTDTGPKFLKAISLQENEYNALSVSFATGTEYRRFTVADYFGGEGIGSLRYCIAYLPDEPTYKYAVITGGLISQPFEGSSPTTMYIIPKINIIMNDGIMAATCPGAHYCIPITFANNSDINYYDVCTFGHYIVLLTGGIYSGAGENAYWVPTNSRGVNSFTTAPTRPMKCLTYKSYLVFVCGYASGVFSPNVIFYSASGSLDSFNTAAQVEYITYGARLLCGKVINDKLYLFATDGIYEYSGVPGDAWCRRISGLKLLSANSIVEIEDGIVGIFTSGIYRFDSTLTYMEELTGTYKSFLPNLYDKYIYMGYDSEHKEIVIQLSNAQTALIIYNIQTDRWSKFYTTYKPLLGTIYYGAYQKVYVYDSTLAGGIYKEGTSYEPFEIESGYIDPDPFYQEKLYTQIVIEATATTASVTADLVITYNNGSSDTFSAVSFTKVGSENYVYIIKPMNRAAKSFKYKITTGGPNTEQIKIHRIVVFYSVGLLKG